MLFGACLCSWLPASDTDWLATQLLFCRCHGTFPSTLRKIAKQALDRLTISPHASLGLAHHHRGAYDESMELDTSAHYDALDLTELYGGLGVEVAHQLTNSVSLRVDTGFDEDFDLAPKQTSVSSAMTVSSTGKIQLGLMRFASMPWPARHMQRTTKQRSNR
ncbi:autotransporter domain-containing protein [Pseudovibrio exalbescens]|uniref:autotransporter domain-containing protein n=1 Tax=Pseudovibrio exalbescens TaxID=197461 RepID=UPI002366116B|nr:autotransporter domain-containing protein [Pseudovibrio exalbescens]MDD7912009.1 autotransporter domain-containing protein [Pseudovibrio exalbescens]